MSAFSIALAALLLGTPLVTLAQATEPVPTHRFYGGLAIYEGSNQSVRGFYSDDQFSIPVQATLGYQLTPRLALQIGLAYSKGGSNYSDTYNYNNIDGIPVTYTTTNALSRRAISSSLLARYTLTRQPSHRFQVDAMGGLSFDHSFYRNSGTNTYTTQGITDVSPYEYSGAYNNLLVNLGPSFRYRFGEHFEVVYDILFNTSLTSGYHSLNMSMALGLRYRFGRG
jgi:hypothetical protein